mmetsp:Transcript_25725/g.43116  ORF Transcript_25725/g.43116 Transcript_25725/m.43116 type:complete len:105 (+) Transcript_25725:1510-1824(+)
MSVHTSLRKVRSCDTTTRVRSPQSCESLSSSHITASRSRWFVGSSSSSTSGSWNSACASATRMRQPPDSDATGVSIICGENCSPLSTTRARSCAPAAPMASSCS